MRRAVCLALLVMVASWAPATASAAPGWLAPVDLSAAGASGPVVAVDAQGDTTVAWLGAGGVVQAATRPAGGTFGAPVTLSSQNATAPVIAVDARGDTLVAWSVATAVSSVVQAVVRPAGGAFGSSADLSAAGQAADSPAVAIDPQGNATVVWRIFANANNTVVQASTRLAATAVWGAAVNVSDTALTAQAPVVAVDALGAVTVAWQLVGPTNIVQAATQSPGGAFSAPVNVSAVTSTADLPALAVSATGAATLVWQLADNPVNTVVQAAARPTRSSAWQAPVNLSAAGATGPVVAIDGSGDVTVAWQLVSGTGGVAQVATRPAGGTFGAAISVSAAGQNVSSSPALAVDAQGDTVVAWQLLANVVQAAVRPPGGSFNAPANLSAPGQNAVGPALALDAQGDAAAAWQRLDAAGSAFVQAAGYDGAGPRLNALAIPALGPTGVPLTFSATPFVVWSGVASTVWTWGDGSSATSGTSVTHSYAAPGSYQITVTVTDGLGNAATAQRTITIGGGVSGGGTSLVPPAKPPPPARSKRPVLRGLSISPSSFRAASSGPSISRAHTGAALSYSDDQAAVTTFTVERRAPGVRLGTQCRRPRKHEPRGAKSCTLFPSVGSFVHPDRTGANRLHFSGRVNRRKLRPGRYRLHAVSRNAAGQASKPAWVDFVILG